MTETQPLRENRKTDAGFIEQNTCQPFLAAKTMDELFCRPHDRQSLMHQANIGGDDASTAIISLPISSAVSELKWIGLVKNTAVVRPSTYLNRRDRVIAVRRDGL
jgi:hypothetical protein